ncbi:EamA family transporter [Marinomonas mediterranea]|uniref:DMT family permease n=1 Tax=Marinomonas mediterranea (strain ATCC 700492 / JCM 21426 / NBRC 103028 / MMB-1) TaxID=717774 RepID=F2JXY6_MARM1|nr:EamA family transporter [Marinomonas mediterranea]ADZ89635.1 DMT family permease [Marinomonas mediterranea MMB-1]WCN07725.1 EamA family transporter [Marinomonas mediterranea]WCN11826.1 EamA family transporter [Marinomonas mediterranea]WCN15874.1 EamA family transporter [Marinomonas mediterranea MMB-1]
MTITAIVLVLISAFMHAGWNYFGKSSSPSVPFFFFVSIAGVVVFSPVLVWQYELLLSIDGAILALLFVTGFFQALYLWGLSEAYKAGDMSVAYPIARSSPLILVCISSFVLGRQDSVSVQAIVGIVLIVAGCFFIPLTSFRSFKLANYVNRTTLFALVAAFATAGYSLVDDEATSFMRALTTPSGEFVASALEIALLYVVLQSLFAVFWMFGFVFFKRSSRDDFYDVVRNKWQYGVLTAVLMLGTYALVILSMAFVDDVSYVVAFRQLSIPLGVLFAVIGFGETLHMPKLTGVILTFIGLVAVALG